MPRQQRSQGRVANTYTGGGVCAWGGEGGSSRTTFFPLHSNLGIRPVGVGEGGRKSTKFSQVSFPSSSPTWLSTITKYVSSRNFVLKVKCVSLFCTRFFKLNMFKETSLAEIILSFSNEGDRQTDRQTDRHCLGKSKNSTSSASG